MAIATAEASPSARVYLERLAHQHNVTCFAKSSDATTTLPQNSLLQSSCVSAVREAAARAGTDVVIVDSPPLSLALHAHANGLLAPFLCESDLILFVVDAQQGMSRSASLARSLSLSRARARALSLSLSLFLFSLALLSLTHSLSLFLAFSCACARIQQATRKARCLVARGAAHQVCVCCCACLNACATVLL